MQETKKQEIIIIKWLRTSPPLPYGFPDMQKNKVRCEWAAHELTAASIRFNQRLPWRTGSSEAASLCSLGTTKRKQETGDGRQQEILMGGQNKQGCSSSPTVELRWFEYKKIKVKEPRTESSPSFQQTCLRMWPLNPDILLRADWTIQVQAWDCDTETDRQRR